MLVHVSKQVSKTHRRGLRRGKFHLHSLNFSDPVYPLVTTSSWKNVTNLYKKSWICSFLVIEVSPPFAYTLFLSATCSPAQRAWEIQKIFLSKMETEFPITCFPYSILTWEFWLVTVFVPFLAKRLALICCAAQKSICIETFCGMCDLGSPISL